MSESTTEETPRPGTRLSDAEAARLIADFEARYRRPRAGQHPSVPTWCTFEQCARSDDKVLESIEPASHPWFFVYFEGGRHFRRATLGEIRWYLEAREPWEDYDIYILPPGLEWCVAFTHEQMDEVEVLVAGELIKPKVQS